MHLSPAAVPRGGTSEGSHGWELGGGLSVEAVQRLVFPPQPCLQSHVTR